jgi:hypothetical protein
MSSFSMPHIFIDTGYTFTFVARPCLAAKCSPTFIIQQLVQTCKSRLGTSKECLQSPEYISNSRITLAGVLRRIPSCMGWSESRQSSSRQLNVDFDHIRRYGRGSVNNSNCVPTLRVTDFRRTTLPRGESVILFYQPIPPRDHVLQIESMARLFSCIRNSRKKPNCLDRKLSKCRGPSSPRAAARSDKKRLSKFGRFV